ncbi:MAG TPA: UbiD family decarboxylase [Xanthobacteraceae bacterium]|jgi:4-hydroxy-3-polyprenylbenzoate decarboxylase|nr:UbiD family decarboxylase [Xanthobacteraceae bacterium]
MLDQPGKTRAKSQSSSPPLDFQEHLARLEAAGLVTRIDRPINKDTELHPLGRWQFQGGLREDQRRAFLFTHVTDSAGRHYDAPVAVGALAASAEIYAIGMGCPVDKIGDAWLHAIANPIPPQQITDAPCQEVVIKGDALRQADGGLKALPVPISTPGYDAAPYLTATLCITKDPETGVRNMGTYRGQLKATDRLGVRMAARVGGAGGYLHWQKHRKLKTPMPIAIVIGCAPVVMFTGPQKLPIDCDEMAVAGGLAGVPIRTVKAATVDLDVPADAEFVIEGLIDPELLEPEGPFGESHGHVALEDFNMSMQVTAITHKKKPIWVSILSEVTPSESSVMKRVAYEPRYLSHLRDTMAIKSVRRVAMHEPLTNLRKVLFVQFAQGAPRTEVWRALQGAASLQADIGKYVIAVSEDIDPENPHAVFWSMAYRANPADDVLVLPHRSAGHGPKSGPRGEESTLLIDATLKEPAPPLALPKREFMEGARKIWDELGLPALTPQPPWYGYSLGEWDSIWDTYAARAVAGKWEESGKETFAHRRAGLTPETPVKSVKE